MQSPEFVELARPSAEGDPRPRRIGRGGTSLAGVATHAAISLGASGDIAPEWALGAGMGVWAGSGAGENQL